MIIRGRFLRFSKPNCNKSFLFRNVAHPFPDQVQGGFGNRQRSHLFRCKNLIGRANRRLGNFDAALEYYYRSEAINPNDLTIRTNIANAISMKGDHAHAKSIYETEIQRLEALNTPDARGVLAITYSSYALCIGKMGDLNGSREYLKKAEKVGYKNSSGIWKQLQHRT